MKKTIQAVTSAILVLTLVGCSDSTTSGLSILKPAKTEASLLSEIEESIIGDYDCSGSMVYFQRGFPGYRDMVVPYYGVGIVQRDYGGPIGVALAIATEDDGLFIRRVTEEMAKRHPEYASWLSTQRAWRQQGIGGVKVDAVVENAFAAKVRYVGDLDQFRIDGDDWRHLTYSETGVKGSMQDRAVTTVWHQISCVRPDSAAHQKTLALMSEFRALRAASASAAAPSAPKPSAQVIQPTAQADTSQAPTSPSESSNPSSPPAFAGSSMSAQFAAIKTKLSSVLECRNWREAKPVQGPLMATQTPPVMATSNSPT